MSRILDFADGFQSSSEPTSVSLPAANVANTPSGNLSATTMQDAVNELQGDIDTINGKVGSPSGIASLDISGKIPTSQIPALAIIDVNVVADIAARDALTVEEGDVSLVTDAGGGVSKTYIYDGSSWIELKTDGSLASHSAATTGTHGVSGNIVGTNDSQVLTNKDIDGGTASNTSRITLPKAAKTTLNGLTRKEGTLVYATDEAKAYVDNGTALVAVGSGSGSGTVNFVTNPKAENDTSNAGVYNDGAVSRPLTGAGVAATTVTIARNTSNALDTTDFLITKPASNVQGQGYSFDVTVPRYARGKVVQVSIYYEIASGTYSGGSSTTDSDLIGYIYNVTDSALIEPAPIKLDGGVIGVQYRYTATFQTSTTASSYRLLLHHATTSASAFTMKVICSVSPQVTSNGSIVTDPTLYTPVFTGLGTVTGIEVTSWRDGPVLKLAGKFTAGTPTATEARMTLGFAGTSGNVTSADTTKIPTIKLAGYGTYGSNAASSPTVLIEPSVGYITFGQQTGSTTGLSKLNGSTFIGTGGTFSFFAEIPIAGWGSTVTSSGYDGRTISWHGTQVSQAVTASVTDIAFTTSKDSHGCWNGTQFVVQEPGEYVVLGAIGNSAAQNSLVYVNGSVFEYGSNSAAGQVSSFGIHIPNCKANDTISIRSNGTGTVSLGRCSIFRLSGASQNMPGETVSFSANTSTTAASTSQCFIYTVVEDNTHGAYSASTGKFTVPISGRYCFQWTNYTPATTAQAILYKNGTAKVNGSSSVASTSAGSGSTTLPLIAGDVIEIRPEVSATAGSLARLNCFSGFKVG